MRAHARLRMHAYARTHAYACTLTLAYASEFASAYERMHASANAFNASDTLAKRMRMQSLTLESSAYALTCASEARESKSGIACLRWATTSINLARSSETQGPVKNANTDN